MVDPSFRLGQSVLYVRDGRATNRDIYGISLSRCGRAYYIRYEVIDFGIEQETGQCASGFFIHHIYDPNSKQVLKREGGIGLAHDWSDLTLEECLTHECIELRSYAAFVSKWNNSADRV